MVYWNIVAKQIFNKIEENIKNKKLKSGFFLVNGPKNIWKKTLIKNLINNIQVLPTDVIFLEDPGKIDGKNYIIKVSVDDKDQKIIVNDKEFLNLGAREISDFLSTTWFGDYKVVVIENIERMNISAINALLKIFEEPPEWAFIFATTSNKNKILATIISRATIINMFPLDIKDFEQFLTENMISLDEHKKNILFAISGGRIWLAKKLLKENNDLLDKIEEYLLLEEKNADINSRFTLLKDLIKENKINLFLDGLIFYYSHTNKFEKLDKIIDIKIKNQANVNLENLLFEYLI